MRVWGSRAAERFVKTRIRGGYRRYRYRHELRPVVDRTADIPDGGIIVFSVVRNEAPILPRFLDHYRGLGVAHFIFLDNESADGTGALLAAETDCSVWSAAGSYRASRHGLDWLNAMLHRHGAGRWCLTVDADEFLVFPHCDSRSLPELTAWLEAEGKPSLYTILIDMYPKGPLAKAAYRPGQDPLDICRWFDACGYHQHRSAGVSTATVRGGVRRRVYFRDMPELAPALNKIPLVKWRRHYSYEASTHVMVPPRCNEPHFGDRLAPTGCLLHFKFFANIIDKAREEMSRRQHWDNGREYEVYLKGGDEDIVLWNEASAEYSGWRQLVDHGLMHVGGWV